MDNQDKRRTHTPGHENHGVHVCHKCGWPFPNPHPSAKHRRAHKKICGTIEGYKLLVSEGQTHLNASDDEHVSDDDRKSPDPKALDTGNNEKGNAGMREKLIRSEDDVFSDAVAEFSDNGIISSGIKEHLQEDILVSGTNVERVDAKDPEFSGSSEDNGFNDVSQLTVKSSDDCQIESPKLLQSEKVEVGNTPELEGQLSGSTVDPSPSSISNLRTEELTVVHGDDCFVLSKDSHPSKAEAMADVFPENKIYTGENVTDCSSTTAAKDTDLNRKDDTKSDRDIVETAVSSDNVVGDTCVKVPKVNAIEEVALDHQVADGAVNLKEKNNDEFLSVLPQDDIKSDNDLVETVVASDNIVGEACVEVPKIDSVDEVASDHQVADEAFNPKEKNNDEFLSVLPHNDNKSHTDLIETVVSSDNVVGETCAEVPKIDVIDEVASDHQVADGAVNLEEKKNVEFLSALPQDDIKLDKDLVETVVSSDNIVGETCVEVPKIDVIDEDTSDHQVADGAVNLKEKNNDEFLSVLPLDDIKSDKGLVETVVASDNIVGETCAGVPKIDVSDAGASDHQVADEAANLMEKKNDDFLTMPPQDDLPLEVNSVVITNASSNDVQVEASHMIQFATFSDVKTLQEKGEGNVNVDTLPTHDDRPDAAHPHKEYEAFKDHEGVISQNPLSLHPSESLKYEQNDLKETVTEDDNFLFNPSQLSEKSDMLSSDMNVLDSSITKELVNAPTVEEMHAEQRTEVSPVKLTVESNQTLDEIGASMNVVKTQMNGSHMVHISEEQELDDVHESSQQISSPKGSLMVSSNGNPRDLSFGSAINDSNNANNIYNISHHEKNRTQINDVAVDGKDGQANVENDIGIKMKSLEPSDLLQLEVKQSSDLVKNDDAGEMGKNQKYDIDAQEELIVRDTSLLGVQEDLKEHGSAGKSKGIECTNIGPFSAAQEDLKEDEINSNVKVHEECHRTVSTFVDSHQASDAELVKAAEDLARKFSLLSSINTEPSAQGDSAVEDNQGGDRGLEVSGIAAVPSQDQSGNNLVKLDSSGIDASVDSSSRCDSLEGNWGSVSVLSMLSDAPAVIDAEALSSTGLLASTEAGKSENNPNTASERPRSEKSEMFEPPSFMTSVERGHVVGPKVTASEVQKGQNQQQLNTTSLQAGWFPTLTEVANQTQGRRKSEEIIAKVTNWSTKEQHTPLKSLLGEAAHSNKPKAPKLEENSLNPKNGKLREDNGSGLTTVNSILAPESPATQTVKDVAKEWNSPARYPADVKREKKKVKSRPFWMPLVCCSTVDPQRR